MRTEPQMNKVYCLPNDEHKNETPNTIILWPLRKQESTLIDNIYTNRSIWDQ